MSTIAPVVFCITKKYFEKNWRLKYYEDVGIIVSDKQGVKFLGQKYELGLKDIKKSSILKMPVNLFDLFVRYVFIIISLIFTLIFTSFFELVSSDFLYTIFLISIAILGMLAIFLVMWLASYFTKWIYVEYTDDLSNDYSVYFTTKELWHDNSTNIQKLQVLLEKQK
jgi:hypothetical protein